MKNYKKKFSGICIFIMTVVLSTGVFAKVIPDIADKVQVIDNIDTYEGIQSDRVQELTEEEYENLELSELNLVKFKSVNLNELERLDSLGHKSYEFNMNSFTSMDHDGFTIKLSDMKCTGGIECLVEITEDGKVIYSSIKKRDTILKFNAHNDGRYKVTVDNLSSNTLTYKITIKSYVK